MNKYEEMTSEFQKDPMESQLLSLTANRIQNNRKKYVKVSFGIMIALVILIIINRISKLNMLILHNSEYNNTIYQLIEHQRILNENFTEINEKHEKILLQINNYNGLINQYVINNSKLMNENLELVNQIKQLKQDINDYIKQRDHVNKSISISLNERLSLINQSDFYNKEINKVERKSKEKERIDLLIDSKIASSPDEVLFIKNQFAFPHIELKLLYRKGQDGYSGKVFHFKCDKAQRTIVLVQINIEGVHYKIGGYTSRSWEPFNQNPTWFREDNTAFLFSLSEKKTYLIEDNTKAIICYEDYLAFFNYDLDISEFGIRSLFPCGYGDYNAIHEKCSLTNGIEFIPPKDVLEIEVFEVLLN